MSRGFVNAGRRISIPAPYNVAAGDLLYYNGFFGVVDDSALTGQLVALILDGGVRILKNVYGSTIPMGTKIFTYASNPAATTAQLFPAASVPAGAVAIGRAWATGVASSATATLKVAMFHPNAY